MKGRISPLLAKMLKDPATKKKLSEALLSGEPFVFEGKTYRVVHTPPNKEKNP